MKESRFLLFFVLSTLLLECKANSEPFMFDPADAEKRPHLSPSDDDEIIISSSSETHKTTTSLIKHVKETTEATLAVEEDSDDSQPKEMFEQDEPSATLEWDDIRNMLHASLRLVTRCSRRYYPGICSEPVNSVWAFSFSHQSCIERLGCRQINKRSNRFETYDECMHSCRSLIDVHTYIMANQEKQAQDAGGGGHSSEAEDESDDEFYEDSMRKGKSARRKSIETLEKMISTAEEYTDDEQSYAIPDSSDGQPPEEVQREMPADIDSVPSAYMDVQYDFNTNRYRTPSQNV